MAKILVVDDEQDLCEILQFNLSRQGYAVDVAYSAEEAEGLMQTQISSLVLQCNSSMIYSIFRNLIDNAIAYSGKGSTISIDLLSSPALGRSGDFQLHHFRFVDDGPGVPVEHLTRIFERFYRVDKGRSRRLGGTGLGLAIVKNAVIMHGGTISASNRQGGGLQFDFTLMG